LADEIGRKQRQTFVPSFRKAVFDATLRPATNPDSSNAFKNGTRIGASASGDRALK
jgi:hypothetical protein